MEGFTGLAEIMRDFVNEFNFAETEIPDEYNNEFSYNYSYSYFNSDYNQDRNNFIKEVNDHADYIMENETLPERTYA